MTNDNDQALHEILEAQQEIDRLNTALMEWENREGSCCPEGVPFERVIEKLKAELESAKRENAQLRREIVAAADLLQLAISRGCWPCEEVVHNELARLRSLCGEKG